MACLDTTDQKPECVATKSLIASKRLTYDAVITAACTSVPSGDTCVSDVENCEQTFLQGVSLAGTDVVAACGAGQTFEDCLKQRDADTNCASHRSVIDNMRKLYTQEISQKGCSSPTVVACVQGMENCSSVYNVKEAKMTSSKECSDATAFVGCLYKLTCTAAYRNQMNQLFNIIRAMIKATKSDCNPFGGVSAVTSSVACLVCGVFLSVFSVFRF
ncbi:uncharacterized protein LOC106012678 [Aplysia californica]|uniref:Uncharacterized protein LOC106012678 n=1 Tax=Aplysia californica TaxID=6500 RepID=A0ABM1A6K3_APLCA|nr:uncharacterized protein LOC106012678 [Aplysia californica]